MKKAIGLTETHEEYAARAKAAWGDTDAYKQFEQKSAGRSKEQEQKLGEEMMHIFSEFSRAQSAGTAPESPEAVALVKKLQAFITAHYYTCTDEILLSLGKMYAAGSDFTESIDRTAGPGTAVYAQKAIEWAVGEKKGTYPLVNGASDIADTDADLPLKS